MQKSPERFPTESAPELLRRASAEVVARAAEDAHVPQQGHDGLDFCKAGLVGQRVIRQNVPDAQQRPAGGVRRQAAVKFLFRLHHITSSQE